MKHGKALLIKFIVSLVLLYVILGLMYGMMTFGEVLLLSVALGIVSYIIGDMLILPRSNNTVATIVDFVLAWAIIYWFADAMTVADNVFTASLISAIVVGVFELFFHRYVANHVLSDDEKNGARGNLQYHTELSDELEEELLDSRNKKDNDK
ncbi:YndM family protein [Oceanobacillus sp. J11TS1]|uniref:YndM family protein n=1 Tax=Oceanobacillus sp. J11TS1 TaxID=2807191 RepID=UPI001B05B8B3|nr:YndM family protein [Oceanobacillus sp. J11TS1]GIO21458.1 putative membrane protein YndM [Oceanobacillus sp. J11TS1]